MSDPKDKIDLIPLDEFDVNSSQPKKNVRKRPPAPPPRPTYTPTPRPTYTSPPVYTPGSNQGSGSQQAPPASFSDKLKGILGYIVFFGLIWTCSKCDDDDSAGSSKEEETYTLDTPAVATQTYDGAEFTIDSSRLYNYIKEEKKPQSLNEEERIDYGIKYYYPAKRVFTKNGFEAFRSTVSNYYAKGSRQKPAHRFVCRPIKGNVLLLKVLDTTGVKRYFIPPNLTFLTFKNNDIKFTETRTLIRLVNPTISFEDVSKWNDFKYSNENLLIQDWYGGEVYNVTPPFIRYYEEIPVVCMSDDYESYMQNKLNIIYIPKSYLSRVLNQQDIDEIDISDIPAYNLKGEDGYY